MSLSKDFHEEIGILKMTQSRMAQKIKELSASVSYRVMSSLGSRGELQCGSMSPGFGVRGWGKVGSPGLSMQLKGPPTRTT